MFVILVDLLDFLSLMIVFFIRRKEFRFFFPLYPGYRGDCDIQPDVWRVTRILLAVGWTRSALVDSNLDCWICWCGWRTDLDRGRGGRVLSQCGGRVLHLMKRSSRRCCGRQQSVHKGVFFGALSFWAAYSNDVSYIECYFNIGFDLLPIHERPHQTSEVTNGPEQ